MWRVIVRVRVSRLGAWWHFLSVSFSRAIGKSIQLFLWDSLVACEVLIFATWVWGLFISHVVRIHITFYIVNILRQHKFSLFISWIMSPSLHLLPLPILLNRPIIQLLLRSSQSILRILYQLIQSDLIPILQWALRVWELILMLIEFVLPQDILINNHCVDRPRETIVCSILK